MTWPDVVALLIVLGTVWVFLAWRGWTVYCAMRVHESDNRLREAQIPRSIFGSGAAIADIQRAATKSSVMRKP